MKSRFLYIAFLLFLSIVVNAQTDTLKTTYTKDNEIDDRLNAIFNIAEQVEKAQNFFSSLTDLIKESEMALPAGIQHGDGKYALYVSKITNYSDDENGFGAEGNGAWVTACAMIKLKNDKEQIISFEGGAVVEGDNGIGTSGYLSIVQPVTCKMGANGSLTFREGTRVNFGCEGITSISAKLTFKLNTKEIYSVDDKGKEKDFQLDFETEFSDFEDFTATLNVIEKFKIRGVNDLTLVLNGFTLDNSFSRTPSTVSFPSDYFINETTDKPSWRGIAISKAEVQLTGIFAQNSSSSTSNDSTQQATTKQDTSKQTQTKQATTINLNNALIDGYGLTGNISASDILPDHAVENQEWGASIKHMKLDLLKGSLETFEFDGNLKIPAFSKEYKATYKAEYEKANSNFIVEGKLADTCSFDMLSAKLQLYKDTKINLRMDNDGLWPTIAANGKLTIEAKLGNGPDAVEIPDIAFQNLTISRESPNISLGTFGMIGKINTPDFAGFKLTIDKFATNGQGDGIEVGAQVHVAEQFQGKTNINIIGDLNTWRFKKMEIDSINIEYNSTPFSLKGGVAFMRGDDIYGKGFRGDFQISLLDGKLGVKAVSVFGKVDNYRYFLTDAFMQVEPSKGVFVAPAFKFYGIGGGLYMSMDQENGKPSSNFGESLSGINYVPNKEVGLGFMASTKFCILGKENLFDATVNLEMQFNRNWGVNYIQFLGDAKMLSQANQGSSSIKELAKKAVNEKSNKPITTDDLEEKPKEEAILQARLGMKYDFRDKVFTADMNAYLDADVLHGTGPNNRMGWASAKFADDEWYAYIGTPQNKLGVEFLKIAKTNGYFMIGSKLPPLEAPPTKVTNSLKSNYEPNINNNIASGDALAFGSDFNIKIHPEFWNFYAALDVELGTDMLLKNYGTNAHCYGKTEMIGINGWFAQAQAWAYVNGDIGMKLKIHNQERKFHILNVEMATLLNGQGPNPLYLAGTVGGKFNVLGGLVKGDCKFDFSVGEKCDVVGASQFGDKGVIAQLTPTQGATDVNVFVAPQLVLNLPVETEMEIEELDNSKATYIIHLDEFAIYTDDNKKVSGKLMFDEDNRLCSIDLESPLESLTKYKVKAKVTFQKKNKGVWQTVKDENGTDIVEEQEVSFTSGMRPNYIQPEHIICSYPADGQYNFYPNEYSLVYVAANKDYSYLFRPANSLGEGIPEGCEVKAQLTSKLKGDVQKADFTYIVNYNAGGITGAITYIQANAKCFKFNNNETYSWAIVNVPKTTTSITDNISENSTTATVANSDNQTIVEETTLSATDDIALLETTEICSFDFRTSNYNTFKAKMEEVKIEESYADMEYINSNNLYSKGRNNENETLDMFEYNSKENNNNNLVIITSDWGSTPWYNNKIAPIMYENSNISQISGYTLPPKVGITLFVNNEDINLLSDKEISPEISIKNSSSCLVQDDFYEIANKLANYVVIHQNNTISLDILNYLKKDRMPMMIKGNYPILFQYVIPGKKIITSSISINIEI